MLKTPPRRLKAIAKTALVMVCLFFATLLVCFGAVELSSFSSARILSPITIAQSAQSGDMQIDSIKTFCQNNHISCQSVIQIDDETIQIIMETNAQVLFSTRKDLTKQLASLQQVTTQLTIKGKQFKKLDFRFDNVIVSF